MKIKSIFQFTVVSLWLVVIAGCVTTPTQRAERLVTPLPKLTTAVDALVRYPDPAHPVSDDQLVTEAIKDLPGLQQAFACYTNKAIKVRKMPVGRRGWITSGICPNRPSRRNSRWTPPKRTNRKRKRSSQ